MAETPGYVSNAKLAERISALVDRWNTRENQMIALLTQPEGDVTVTDGLGKDRVLPSFPQLYADVSDLVDELTGAVAGASDFASMARLYAEGAQASANDAQASAEDTAERLKDATARAEAAAESATASAASATASALSNQSAGLHEKAASASAADADADAIQAANSKSNAVASASAAASSEDQAASYAHQAEDWSDQAQAWANAPAGTEIEPGAYSAKHWSEQARASLTGTLIYRGGWDASTGSFPQGGNTGAFYKVTVGGFVDARQYNPGDQIVSNGAGWDHIDNTEQVTSVAGKSGAVQLVPGDVSGLGALATRDTVDFNSHVANKPTSYPPSTHTHTKGDVGLSNVDNTSDANKPISSAQQAALDAKAPRVSPVFTGLPVVGDGTLQVGSSNGGNMLLRFDGLMSRDKGTTWQTLWNSGNFNPDLKFNASGGWISGRIGVEKSGTWDSGTFGGSHIELRTPQGGTAPSISFHRSGSDAISLGFLGGNSDGSPGNRPMRLMSNTGLQRHIPTEDDSGAIRHRRIYVGDGAENLVNDGDYGIQCNGRFRTTAELYQLNLGGTAWIRQARTFVSPGDPGGTAQDGDLWIW